MKVNDIVLDKKQKIGIISKIENHKITVSYNILQTSEYDEEDPKLTVLDEALIEFIYQTVDRMGQKGKYLSEVFDLNITGISYVDKILAVDVYQRNHFKITIDYQNLITKSSTENQKDYTHQILIVLSHLAEQFSFLKSIKNDAPSIIDDLIKITNEFIRHFFDFSLFDELVRIIQKKEIKELYLYCIKIVQTRMDSDLESYLLFLVSTSTDYARQLCFAFSKDSQNIFEIFYWTLTQSNYTNNEKYIVYSSIQMMKERRYEEWVQMMFVKGKAAKLIDGRATINKVFKAIINKTTNIMFYWKLIDCYCMFFEKEYYDDIIFRYSSIDNQIVLLENGFVANIDDSVAETYDLDTFLKYQHFMTKTAIRKCINKNYNELIRRNPKQIIDLLISPSKSAPANADAAIIKKVLPHIPDSKYLQTFLNTITTKGYFVKLENVMNRQS